MPLLGTYANAAGPGGMPASLMLRAAETSSFGLTLADVRKPDLPLVYANKAFQAMTGYETKEILGKNCRFLQGPETDRESVAKIRQALEAEASSTILLLNYRKDGTPFWNRFQMSPVRDEAGHLIAYFGMQVDITQDVERIGLESERQKQAATDRLAGGVAQDLENTLQPILQLGEMLKKADDLKPQAQADCAKGIVENARLASDLVNRMLSADPRKGS